MYIFISLVFLNSNGTYSFLVTEMFVQSYVLIQFQYISLAGGSVPPTWTWTLSDSRNIKQMLWDRMKRVINNTISILFFYDSVQHKRIRENVFKSSIQI